jgi:hypothetical protein
LSPASRCCLIPRISLAALVAALVSGTGLSAQTAVLRDTLGKYPLDSERFDNHTATGLAVFVANYLLSADDHELVRLLK